jgi:chromosome condensin MukBEF MukE localization factor
MNTELEAFSKETLVAYSSCYFFVCPEELRNIAFHHRQQIQEKKMKQVNESQQLKRNMTERCRKYNNNNQRNVPTSME